MKSLIEVFSEESVPHFFKTPIPKTDKGTVHSYIEWYSDVLEPYRMCKYFVEIGIFNGSSVDLWRRYLHTDTKIFALDMNPHLYEDEIEEYKTQNVFIKQNIQAYSQQAIDWILEQTNQEKINVFIDDGSHLLQDNVWILKNYGKIINAGGILIIEDIDLTQRRGENILSILENTMKTVDYEYTSYEIVDRRSVKQRKDDILFVVRF